MNSKIEIINNWNIQKVFNELENGNMKIPRFQRGYVWERSKIVKLLNSIYEEYPIGTFFIWEASSEYSDFCRNIPELGLPDKPEANKFQFIIDGQQRITSLYVALKGKKLGSIDYSAICFNLDKKRFQIPMLKTEQNNIPAWKIFDNNEIMALIGQYALADAQNGTTYNIVLQTCKRILDNYPVSLIKTLNVELDEAVNIFENINQGGKRLSLFDLVHASVWSQDFDLRNLIKEFNEEVNVKQFGGLEEETITQSLALNIRNNCQKTNQLHLTSEECKGAWRRTLECLRLSIDFVKNYGAQKKEILPYESTLPVIQYYFFKTGKSAMKNNHRNMINDWFWTTVFSRRYSSSTLTRMKEDADWVASIISGSIESRIFGINIDYNELRRILMGNNSVVKDGVLCILAANSPVDFSNGDAVILDKTNASRANAKENHHFFPFSRKGDFNISQDDVNCLLNFAFISKSLNQEISKKLPSDYLAGYAAANTNIKQMLGTHFIEETAYNCALNNDFNGFVAARGELILARINELCKVNQRDNAIYNVDDEEVDTSEETEQEFVEG